jgi:hypothetical protein
MEEILKNQKIEINKLLYEKDLMKKEIFNLKSSLNTLGLNLWDKIYLEYKTIKGNSRHCLAYVRKETINHLKVSVYDPKENRYWSYIILKELITGIKLYDLQECEDDEFLKKLKEQINKK